MSDAGHAVTLRELRGFIFDADGTLYRGEAVLPGAAEFIADLRRLGIPWLVATNNSTMPPAGVAARLTRMGIPATAADVINSSQVAAAYVAREMPGAGVFMVGEAGVREALVAAGVVLTEDWQAADAVVVGLDRGPPTRGSGTPRWRSAAGHGSSRRMPTAPCRPSKG